MIGEDLDVLYFFYGIWWLVKFVIGYNNKFDAFYYTGDGKFFSKTWCLPSSSFTWSETSLKLNW